MRVFEPHAVTLGDAGEAVRLQTDPAAAVVRRLRATRLLLVVEPSEPQRSRWIFAIESGRVTVAAPSCNRGPFAANFG